MKKIESPLFSLLVLLAFGTSLVIHAQSHPPSAGDPVAPERRPFPERPVPGGRPPQPNQPGPGGRLDRPAPPQSGPWNNDVRVYRVDEKGRAEQVAEFPRAGVPTVSRLADGRLLAAFQHFPAGDEEGFDKVAVCFSEDEGRAWIAPQTAVFRGLPEGMMRPFDPTLVALPDGRVRLYFTGNYHRVLSESRPAIHSAVSADGIVFDYEPGVRFEVEGRMTIDCAAVLHRDRVHLYAPVIGGREERREGGVPTGDSSRAGIGYHAVSDDGLAFTRLDDVQVKGRRSWLGNAVSEGDGIVFFGTEDGGPAPGGGHVRGGVWMARSADGSNWETPKSIEGAAGADPGAVRSREGGWILLLTTPPVRNDPSPRREKNR